MSNRIVGAISLAFTLIIVYLAYSSLEYYEEEVDTGWSKEARRNQYLAAELYAKGLGLETKSYDSFLKLDVLDDINTIFIAESGQILSQNRLDSLLKWVEGGGHLIVAAQKPSDWNNDRILAHFGLTVEKTDYYSVEALNNDLFSDFGSDQDNEDSRTEDSSQGKEDSDGDAKAPSKPQKMSERLKEINDHMEELTRSKNQKRDLAENISEYESSIDVDELTKLRFESIDYTLNAHFYSGIKLVASQVDEQEGQEGYSHEIVYSAGDEWGKHLVQIESGLGLVTILSDPSVVDSKNIGYFDHAFLWQILIGNEYGQLVILYGSDMPSLWFMLRTFMPEMLLTFAAFVIAWLWYQMQRFGSICESDYQVRRSILEHISASAYFLWRGGWQRLLLKPIQKEIQRIAERTIPAFSSASDEDRLNLLAAQADLSPDIVKNAMQALDENNEERFLSTVKVLQRIKDSL